MEPTIEQRSYEALITIEESRAEGDTAGPDYFDGEAIVFGKPSELLYSDKYGFFIEVIERSALDNTDMSGVVATHEHDKSRLLGSTYGNTLTMTVTDTGLKVRIQKPNTTVGNDCYESVRRGDLRFMSFRQIVGTDRWEMRAGTKYRFITGITKLRDVTLTCEPAYRQTAVESRSYDAFEAELKAAEQPTPQRNDLEFYRTKNRIYRNQQIHK